MPEPADNRAPEQRIAIHRLLEAAATAAEQLRPGAARIELLMAIRTMCALVLDVQEIEAAQNRTVPVPPTRSWERLSERELTVLQLLAKPLSMAKIAAELWVSQNTVKTHVRNIYRKLDVGKRGDALARAIDLGLI
jgi:ATP/maltotriose-dependent transcriptional regulator MalT